MFFALCVLLANKRATTTTTTTTILLLLLRLDMWQWNGKYLMTFRPTHLRWVELTVVSVRGQCADESVQWAMSDPSGDHLWSSMTDCVDNYNSTLTICVGVFVYCSVHSQSSRKYRASHTFFGRSNTVAVLGKNIWGGVAPHHLGGNNG